MSTLKEPLLVDTQQVVTITHRGDSFSLLFAVRPCVSKLLERMGVYVRVLTLYTCLQVFVQVLLSLQGFLRHLGSSR
jgi:hypothetical protein